MTNAVLSTAPTAMAASPASGAPVRVAVRNLDFYYGSFHALKHIDVDVHNRETTALIGLSGCGKSTRPPAPVQPGVQPLSRTDSGRPARLTERRRVWYLPPNSRRCGNLQMTGASRSNLLQTLGAVSSPVRGWLTQRKRPQAPSGAAIVAGSSHIMCFGVPLRGPSVDLLPLSESGARFMCLNGPFPRTTSYWRTVESLARHHKLFLYWQGNQHMAEHLFASSPPFDFVLAERPDLPLAPEAAVVAEQMVREKFGQARSFERLAALLKRIAERGTPGVYVCGTPPPKGDTGAIRAALGREDYFVERLAKLGTDPNDVPLTPPQTLYKLWSVVQSMLRDVAEAHGAAFVPIPAEAQTPQGFLRQEFWGRDITHASATLGPVVLRTLARHL